MISACCDSGAAAFTNTWLNFVVRYNWGRHSVDISSCLQGWNKDLTPTVVQCRHQLGMVPVDLDTSPPLSTSPFCLLHKSLFQLLSQKTSSLTSLLSLCFTLFIRYFYLTLLYFPKASLFCCSLSSLNPSLPTSPCPSSSHLQILSSAQHWFSANFSSLLEHQSLWHSSSWLLWWLHTASLGLGGGQLKRRMRTLESCKCCLLQVVQEMQQ